MKTELEDLQYQRFRPCPLCSERVIKIRKKHVLGVVCDDSWVDLIDALCTAIQIGSDNAFTPPVTIMQIKEKTGTLRFRVRAGPKFGANEWRKVQLSGPSRFQRA